jgi:hypothetical protein
VEQHPRRWEAVADVVALSEQFGKQKPDDAGARGLTVEDLELICFEYVTA